MVIGAIPQICGGQTSAYRILDVGPLDKYDLWSEISMIPQSLKPGEISVFKFSIPVYRT